MKNTEQIKFKDMYKYLFLLFLAAILTACTGTKTTGDTSENETPQQNNTLECDSDNPAQDVAWIREFAAKYKGRDVQAHITRYELDGDYFFEVNNCVNCADSMTVLYTCDHGKKCETGGIAGLQTCGDFYDKAGKGEIIWKNYEDPR